MKAAVLYETNTPLVIEDVDIDPPKAFEVKVKLAVTGVCHSDLHFMTGHAPIRTPAVLGHEGSAVVSEIGEGVTSVQPGDHVILSFSSYCGRCESCLLGHRNSCDAHQRDSGKMFDGTSRIHIGGQDLTQMVKLGCFGEEAVVPETGVVKIDPSIPLESAALIGCSVTTGVGSAIYAAGVHPGSTVAVIGVGGVGLNIVQGARVAGASRIIAVDLNDAALEFATRFGATHSVNPRNGDPVKAVRDLTEGKGADYTFEAIGLPETVTMAFEAARKHGTAVVAGISPFGESASIDPVMLVRQEKTLKGAYYGSSKPPLDFYHMVEMYETGQIDIDGLITRSYKLEQVNEAYEELARGAVGRGVIRFDD
ncbi:MAG: Zn-dependent alcohol dehydrogenase [Chloroflexi bacterium]|nr:Zn-dependent alcohol dehydrogenase [Chloroflexota bacterium]